MALVDHDVTILAVESIPYFGRALEKPDCSSFESCVIEVIALAMFFFEHRPGGKGKLSDADDNSGSVEGVAMSNDGLEPRVGALFFVGFEVLEDVVVPVGLADRGAIGGGEFGFQVLVGVAKEVLGGCVKFGELSAGVATVAEAAERIGDEVHQLGIATVSIALSLSGQPPEGETSLTTFFLGIADCSLDAVGG